MNRPPAQRDDGEMWGKGRVAVSDSILKQTERLRYAEH
jgi:hypothetical protein